MKIYFFETQSHEKEFFQDALQELQPHFVEGPLTQENVAQYQDADIISIFLISHITSTLIQQMPHLKYIVVRATGFDHIDLNAARTRMIAVSNMPTYAAQAVAEYTFALILALSRKIALASTRAKQLSFSCNDLQGFDLQGKTLGIVGLGNIGSRVIRIAHGFGMNVIGFDPKIQEDVAHAMGFEPVDSLEKLLAQADSITLHVPYESKTHYLINVKNLALVKKTAIIINTSRGSIIDTQALYGALKNKNITGAALDVLECEEDLLYAKNVDLDAQRAKILAINKQLLQFDNVIMTPHNAFNTKESMDRMLTDTAACIRGFIHDKLLYLVT